MQRNTRGLAGSLIISTILFAAPSGALARVPAAGAKTKPAPSKPAQALGAAEEREQGRALLRRGKASEALIHLERALKDFQQSSNRLGEASTLDLLGELYERQGSYDFAL